MNRTSFESFGDPAEIAAGWIERLTADPFCKEDIAALREWLAADPRNRKSYEVVRAIWTALPFTWLSNTQQMKRCDQRAAQTIVLPSTKV